LRPASGPGNPARDGQDRIESAADHARDHAAQEDHEAELADSAEADARAVQLLLSGAALARVRRARPAFRLRDGRQRHPRASVHHDRDARDRADAPPRRDVDARLAAAARTELDAPAQAGVRLRDPRRDPFLVAGEGGYPRAAALRADPRG